MDSNDTSSEAVSGDGSADEQGVPLEESKVDSSNDMMTGDGELLTENTWDQFKNYCVDQDGNSVQRSEWTEPETWVMVNLADCQRACEQKAGCSAIEYYHGDWQQGDGDACYLILLPPPVRGTGSLIKPGSWDYVCLIKPVDEVVANNFAYHWPWETTKATEVGPIWPTSEYCGECKR